MAIIFDGYQLAAVIERELQQQTQQLLVQGKKLCIAAVLFTEDQGSVLYTQLKKEAATRLQIEYRVQAFSLRDEAQLIINHLQQLNADPTVTGIIIQKPWRQTWQDVTAGKADHFQPWWDGLTQVINQSKDVDGLHPQTLAAIKTNTWQQQGKVLPATCQAVLTILEQAEQQLIHQPTIPLRSKVVILGKSDLLGQPLFFILKNQAYQVEMIGSRELTARVEQGIALTDADVVVSATGRHHLITGSLLKPGSIVVDVGEPKPDVEMKTAATVASFITPVPGGVGPMTVVSLMQNCVKLIT